MKYLILFLLFSVNCYSGMFTSKAYLLRPDCKIRGITNYFKTEYCQIKYNDCVEIPANHKCETFSELDTDIDDLSKPVYSKNEISQCDEYCESIFSDKVCSDLDEVPILNLDLGQIYCSKLLRYQQKTVKRIREDSAKKVVYDAQVAAGNALKAAFKQAYKAQDCGKQVKALLLIRNFPKGLTKAQKKQLVKDNADTIRLLDAGSLDAARDEILATIADGVIITEGDKIALVSELDSCK